MSEDQKKANNAPADQGVVSGDAPADQGVVSGDAPADQGATQSGKPAKDAKPSKSKKAGAPAKDVTEGKPARASRGKVRARARRWPAVLAGSTTAVLAVAAVAAGTLLPGADATARLSPGAQVLPVGVSLANCAGPTQLLSGSAAGTDPGFSPNSSSTTTMLNALALSAPDGVLPGASVDAMAAKPAPLFTISPPPADAPAATAGPGTPATMAPLTGAAKARAAVVRDKAVDAASVLRALPYAGQSARSAGSVVVTAGDGDLRGLAAATCQTPSNDFWLSGAGTSVGRTAVLVLANSTTTPATVTLGLFGATGPVQAPGGKALVIAPGTTRSVVLSGLAPDQELLSLHVNSTGGAVTGIIQQSVLRGLTPGGVDFLQPIGAPASEAVIPGVRVQDPAAAAKISAQSGYADASAALEVTVPGGTDAVVEVKAYGPSGQAALPGGGVFTAAAGKVSSLPLSGLPQGTYSLSVTSDSAVVAGARLADATKPGSAVDFAFAPSAGRLGVNHLATLPGGVDSSFAFTAPAGAATVTMVPVSAAGVLGAAKTVELKAGVTTVVGADALLGKDAAAVLVSASGEPAYGSQLLGSKGSANIAVLPFAPAGAETHSVEITTGY